MWAGLKKGALSYNGVYFEDGQRSLRTQMVVLDSVQQERWALEKNSHGLQRVQKQEEGLADYVPTASSILNH